MNKISMPHDHTFRSAMANKQVAIEFFKLHLPEVVSKAIDFKTLRLCQETFISKELRLTSADVLYAVHIAGQESYIYVLSEHQRNPDPFMPFRVLQYIVAVMEKHRKQYPTEAKLPLVVPLVFFNGKNSYPYATDIKELIAAPRTLIDAVLFQSFTLIDAYELSDEQIRRYCWGGLLQLFLKYTDNPDPSSWISTYIPLFKQVEKEGGSDYIISLLYYLIKASEAKNFKNVLELIENNLTNATGEKMMTIAEHLRQEGLQQGEAVLLIQFLEQKFGIISETDLSRIRQADAKTLLKWGKRVLDARVITDVLH